MNTDFLSPEMQEQIKQAFSPELLERVKGAQSIEELLDSIQSEGMVLSEEQLELVAGGGCPTCDGYC